MQLAFEWTSPTSPWLEDMPDSAAAALAGLGQPASVAARAQRAFHSREQRPSHPFQWQARATFVAGLVQASPAYGKVLSVVHTFPVRSLSNRSIYDGYVPKRRTWLGYAEVAVLRLRTAPKNGDARLVVPGSRGWYGLAACRWADHNPSARDLLRSWLTEWW